MYYIANFGTFLNRNGPKVESGLLALFARSSPINYVDASTTKLETRPNAEILAKLLFSTVKPRIARWQRNGGEVKSGAF